MNIDVSGGTVTTAQMEKAVDRADRGETITIEASSRSSVSLPSSGLQDAADNNNDVTVELKNGEVTLSPEALSAVAEQAGTTVTLTVDPVDTDELNSRQQAAVGDAPVFDLTIKSGGKTITDFDGGLVTVAIPYELPDGQDPAGVVVWFMDDNGNITACETMYDLRTETVIFTTRHFSKYVIGYEEPMNFTRRCLLFRRCEVGRGRGHYQRHQRHHLWPGCFLHPCADGDIPLAAGGRSQGHRQQSVYGCPGR